MVSEPPIVPPKIVDDTRVVSQAAAPSGAVIAPRPAVVTSTPAVVMPNPAVTIAPVTVGAPTILGRYTFGFYDDGNADDNWYYDFYEAPKAAAAVTTQPPTDAVPGFRTNWTYIPLAERGLFSW